MSQSPTDTEFTPQDIQRLAALVEKHDLTELRFEQDDVRVTLRTAAYFRQQGTGTVGTLMAAPVAVTGEARHEDGSTDADELEPDVPEIAGVTIEAPIMGTFYHAASPADPPFVEVGSPVEVGDTVGLIEAMKVFSEVKSEVSGVVSSIPAANKVLVNPGDPLVIITTD